MKAGKKRGPLVVGLDIGTTNVRAIIGEATADGVDLVGVGVAPCAGLRKGVVINMEATTHAIREALEEAEAQAGCRVSRAIVGISGGHIKSLNSRGMVTLRDGEVTEQDVVRVFDAAQAIEIPTDRELLHIIPQEYILDDQDGIRDPYGMSGTRLSAKVHIVTASVTSVQNLIKCCHKTGLHVQELVLQQLAASEAVLTSDERELGVAVVDIGGGTTDLAVFHGGVVQHTAVLSLGGDHITRDISIGLGTTLQDAEKLKLEAGSVLLKKSERNMPLVIPGVGGRPGRPASRKMLAEIIEPRLEEMFALVGQELTRSGLDTQLSAGVVLTGGTPALEGVAALAEQVLGLSVRVGTPQAVLGAEAILSRPSSSTAVGLVLHGMRQRRAEVNQEDVPRDSLYRRARSRLGEWIGNIF
ncbi:MAG: cell division protein FtsA [Myxococcota bacterium]